jgi:hypothetical protein
MAAAVRGKECAGVWPAERLLSADSFKLPYGYVFSLPVGVTCPPKTRPGIIEKLRKARSGNGSRWRHRMPAHTAGVPGRRAQDAGRARIPAGVPMPVRRDYQQRFPSRGGKPRVHHRRKAADAVTNTRMERTGICRVRPGARGAAAGQAGRTRSRYVRRARAPLPFPGQTRQAAES